ncbi:MAG TPA: LysM peptidoglycan-binding domain-containing protein [Candidatus Sulfotelmatobacter sp.]|nr:LysM peptidoglycan-binding domain-containing protein [Candidatus Sulfotelmatobacter sp.]
MQAALVARSSQYRDKLVQANKRSKKTPLTRVGLIAAGLVIVLVAFFFIFSNTKTTSANSFTLNSTTQTAAANPLDQVSSASIAQTVADLDNLPEATAVTNQAQSVSAEEAIAEINSNVVQKPEIVDTALKTNADINTYITQAGDTVASVAAKFGLSAQSIQWSNGLSSNSLSPGEKLLIPPVNGVVYTVQAGDTPASLASRFHSNAQSIVEYNNAEISGLTPGEQIIIPGGTMGATVFTGSDIDNGTGSVSSTSFPWGNGPIYGSNGYDFGYCTWYVATQIPVPSNWGNAATWAYYAALSGWDVSTTPTVGAIAQTPYAAGGEGHVAIVDAVSPDGQEIEIRDMNGIAGWDRVGYSGWIPASTFVHFITH